MPVGDTGMLLPDLPGKAVVWAVPSRQNWRYKSCKREKQVVLEQLQVALGGFH